MPSNFVTSLTPVQTAIDNTYLYRRPLSVAWSSLNVDFSPAYGQEIRIRERYQVTIAAADERLQVYTNLARFLPVQNVGHWQILYKDQNSEYYIERDGQAECPTGSPNQSEWILTIGYDWTYRLFRQKDDFFGAVLSVIKNCNADLEPGVVPNGFVDQENYLQFVAIAAKFYGGNPVQAVSELADLLNPTTTGYRFPDKDLFTALTQLPVVDLDSYSVQTAIGDLGLWIHPFFEPIDCEHSIEVRHYGKVPKLANQLTPPVCAYPQSLTLGNPNCERQFTNFLSVTRNAYRTREAAIAAIPAGFISNGIPATQIGFRSATYSVAGCPNKTFWTFVIPVDV